MRTLTNRLGRLLLLLVVPAGLPLTLLLPSNIWKESGQQLELRRWQHSVFTCRREELWDNS
jgi:hypothetical protein